MQYGIDNRYSMLPHDSSLAKASKSNARNIPCKDRCGIRIVIDTFGRGLFLFCFFAAWEFLFVNRELTWKME
jgi:hypothetical protein